MRTAARLVPIVILAMLSCTMPTDMCGCTTPPSSVVVAGTLVDGMSQPVSGARLAFDGSPPGSVALHFHGDYRIAPTDPTGAFSGLVYSIHAPGLLELRAAVVRTAGADTVRIDLGPVPFRSERDVPDTVRFTIRLP